jgi:hypothetical protein
MIKKIINFLKNPKTNYSNFYYIKYYIYKAAWKIGKKLHLFSARNTDAHDMFNWNLYNLHYRGELREEAKVHAINLEPNDYALRNNELTKINQNIKPLHDNHLLLYETILQLNPDSVIEMGCGNGMHLHNLNVLVPKIKLTGVDKDEKQLAFLHECYPDLKAKINKLDATLPLPSDYRGIADLSFTQAVLMHIHTNATHLVALENLFNLSKKHVVMMEKWRNHNFFDDIKMLYNHKKIGWTNLFFYYKISKEFRTPHLMICSEEPLDYPELTDYNIFLKNCY